MSNIYLDIIKDRLYCDAKTGKKRRSGQTAIYIILDAMVRLLAPILAFTSNEIWLEMPHTSDANAEHVMLNDMIQPNSAWVISEEKAAYWDAMFRFRTDVNKALELARAEKVVGKPLDAHIVVSADAEAYKTLSAVAPETLAEICIVSKVELTDGAIEGYVGTEFTGITVAVKPSEAPKCVRCWTHNEHVGENADHPELCPRCAGAISE